MIRTVCSSIGAAVIALIIAACTVIGKPLVQLDKCDNGGPESACSTLTLHYDAQGFTSGTCLVGPLWEMNFIRSHGDTEDGCH